MALLVGFRPLVNLLAGVFRRDAREPGVSDPTTVSSSIRENDTKLHRTANSMVLLSRLSSITAWMRSADSRGLWIATALTVAAVEIALAALFWDWLMGDDSGSETVRNVGLMIAASLAFVLAIWRAVVADRQSTTAQQGLLNERYQRGVEMLGSEVLSVRIGGIYSLRQLSRERPDLYHLHMMRLLCAYVRNPPLGQPGQTELVTKKESSGIQFPTSCPKI